MTKKQKKYGRIRDLKPGTKFIGNRHGRVAILLSNEYCIKISAEDYFECDVPCFDAKDFTLHIVADHEIVELV